MRPLQSGGWARRVSYIPSHSANRGNILCFFPSIDGRKWLFSAHLFKRVAAIDGQKCLGEAGRTVRVVKEEVPVSAGRAFVPIVRLS